MELISAILERIILNSELFKRLNNSMIEVVSSVFSIWFLLVMDLLQFADYYYERTSVFFTRDHAVVVKKWRLCVNRSTILSFLLRCGRNFHVHRVWYSSTEVYRMPLQLQYITNLELSVLGQSYVVWSSPHFRREARKQFTELWKNGIINFFWNVELQCTPEYYWCN